jgi:hypothetical protein
VSAVGRVYQRTVLDYADRLARHERSHVRQIESILQPNEHIVKPGEGMDSAAMNIRIEFNGKIWYWKGPAPWFFVTVPADESDILKDISGLVTYGWGVIPVHARINNTEWQTSLFPKDGRYLVPIKARVRKAERLEEGDNVTVQLQVRL